MENTGIFYGYLEYFTVIWYILWPFVNVAVIWYIFPRFGILCQEKSGNPACDVFSNSNFTKKRNAYVPFPPHKLFFTLST
jgi:hypothetical protein